MKIHTLWAIFTLLPKLRPLSTYQAVFLPNSSNFEEIVKCSGFVDKTLLIEAFFNFDPNKHHVITRPRKFGKSTNMDMLRQFVQLEVDEDGQVKEKFQTHAYHFFTNKTLNFRIASYSNIINDHLAKYPVIHIEFKGIMGNTYYKTLENIRQRIRNTCLPYEWMIEILHKRYKKTKDQNIAQQVRFLKNAIYGTRTMNLKMTMNSLSSLAKILLNYFRRKLFVFIDDYDEAIDYGIRYAHRIKYDPSGIRDILNSMMWNLFDEPLPHIKYIMITGVARGLPFIFNEFQIILEHHKFLNSFEMGTFFGLTDDQVVDLLARHGVDENEKYKVMEYYNGYLNPEWNITLYNTHSVLSYLASYEPNKISYPLSWINSGSLDFFFEALRNPKIYYFMLQMSMTKTGNFSALSYSSEEKLIKLMIQFNKKAALGSDMVMAFLWYCMENGYITRTESWSKQRFPNKEIQIEFTKILFRFYRKHVGQITDPLSDVFKKLIRYEDVENEVFNLKHGLETLISSQFNYDDCDCEELHYFASIYYLAKLNFNQVFTEVKKHVKETAYYVVVNDAESSTVIAVKYHSTVKKALRQAFEFESNEISIQRGKSVRYIGIRIKLRRKIVNVAYFSPDGQSKTHYAVGNEEEESSGSSSDRYESEEENYESSNMYSNHDSYD